MEQVELTILMPVLNEEETIEICIKKAKKYLNSNNINGEILIADNGSTDNSRAIAKNLGARVILVKNKGYGNALIQGIKEAKGKYIIMADADDSYDLEHLELFYKNLKEGYDLIMGDRFKGGIEKNAMKLSHKIGVKALSFIGRKVSKCNVYDFHCGIRGLNTKKIQSLHLKEPGMEFASEMIVKAARAGFKIIDVPTTLSKDRKNKRNLTPKHNKRRNKAPKILDKVKFLNFFNWDRFFLQKETVPIKKRKFCRTIFENFL